MVISGITSRAMSHGNGGPLTSFCILFWREEVVTVATEFLGACKLEARASRHRPCRLQQCEACIAQSPYILRSSVAPAPLWNPLLPRILSSRLLWKLAVQILVKCCILLCLQQVHSLEWGSLSRISEASTQFSKGMQICHGVSWQGGETDCPTGNKGGRARRYSSPLDVLINPWSLPVLAVSCT